MLLIFSSPLYALVTGRVARPARYRSEESRGGSMMTDVIG
jgi:hypothetical protein